MGNFWTGSLGSARVRSGARAATSERHEQVPARFEATGEALASDPDVVAGRPGPALLDACVYAGMELGRDGVPLEDALDGLRATNLAVLGSEPSYPVVRAMASGWSEATLGYLHQLTCEDPLTGLASLPHLRSRISEVYRDQGIGAPPVRTSHALVVVDTVDPPQEQDVFAAALRIARLAETLRTVFAGGDTLGRVGRERIAVLIRRDEG
ncbi:MAG TPA: hypothetical protein VFG97_00740, partial [Pedococcus sp.]|nr:hypothetical protein [Pedococcus sp.]